MHAVLGIASYPGAGGAPPSRSPTLDTRAAAYFSDVQP
jgi:hypothetical protein